LRHRTFLLAAGDECDRIHQPCFVRAELASASENQACQCQRQNGLNFQVSLPSGQHACSYLVNLRDTIDRERFTLAFPRRHRERVRRVCDNADRVRGVGICDAIKLIVERERRGKR